MQATFVQEVARAFAAGQNVVLHAPTGAGKSTLLPLALLKEGGFEGRILLVQPRQVAARAVAARLAQLAGCAVGEDVGYHVRFDKKMSKRTRLLVVTDGIALQRLQADPLMEETSVLLLDEFHERSSTMDLLIAFAREAQDVVGDALRIGVLSATLDVERVQHFLDAAVVRAEGRTFPLDIHFSTSSFPRPWGEPQWERSYARLIESACDGDGNVLVFLPGVGEILRVGDALEPFARAHGVEVAHLYGSLSADEQDRALREDGPKRVILATNVAETSLTVPGVDTVVDFGWVRRARVHPGLQVNRLQLERVSRASADQRAGRAGRVRAGRVFRAWSEADHRRLDAAEAPEIRRTDLATTVMEVLRWRGRDVDRFTWFESPDAASLAACVHLLEALGLIADGVRTPLAEHVARLPLHPRLGRVVLDAYASGVEETAASFAVLLGETDFPRGFPLPQAGEENDLTRALALIDGRGGPEALRAARRARSQILAIVRSLDRASIKHLTSPATPKPRDGSSPCDPFRRAVIRGFPDRIAQRREEHQPRARLVTGTGVTLHPQSSVYSSMFFVALDMDARATDEPTVTAALGVEREDIPTDHVVVDDVYRFDPQSERIEAMRVERIDRLVLNERPVARYDTVRVANVLWEAAVANPKRALTFQDDEAVNWLARYAFASAQDPDTLPPLDDAFWAERLAEACVGKRSFDELRALSVGALAEGGLTWAQGQQLEALAPVALRVPSGSLIRLDYSQGGPPVLAVRLQELFGCVDTPTVGRSRVPVSLHLLAPNYRPQQVTSDLAGFWDRTYPEVRKELRARYPKHAWPDDPRTAPPQRGAKRRS